MEQPATGPVGPLLPGHFMVMKYDSRMNHQIVSHRYFSINQIHTSDCSVFSVFVCVCKTQGFLLNGLQSAFIKYSMLEM